MSARLEERGAGTSDGSLVRSFIGSWMREVGGWLSTAHLVQLLGDAGVPAAGARTNLSRLKGKGLLVAEPRAGVTGYRLADDAHPVLARGDRRIYRHHQMRDDDPWMLVVFSVPETERRLRHRLRGTLTWMGCGAVAPGVWIGPGHLLAETREVLSEEGLARYTTVFCTGTPMLDGDLRASVERWWDLDDLGGRYDRFLAEHADTARRWDGVELAGPGGADDAGDADADVHRVAYADHLRLVDGWRSIPYLDPGLPDAYLPPDWPGTRGVALFTRLHERLRGPALRHVLAVTGRTAPGTSSGALSGPLHRTVERG